MEMDVDNASGFLAPGMFRRTNGGAATGAYALCPTQGGCHHDRVQVRHPGASGYGGVGPGQKGQSVGNLIEVFGVLQQDDLVVARGTDELRSGTKVTILAPRPQT